MKPYYLVVTPFFPADGYHYGVYCYDFVRALMRTGRYDVRVFVPGDEPDYDYQGVLVYRFPVKMLPSAVLPFLFARWNCRSFQRKVEAVGLSFADIAVCHGHTAFFGIYPLAVKRKNPACLTLLHHHDPASFGLNLGRLRYVWVHKAINFFLLRRMHERIDLHVFISHLVERSFRLLPDASWSIYVDYRRQMRGLGWFRGVRVKASTVLHNGVEPRIFHPRSAHHSGFIIGCVGNAIDWKDQPTLVRALALLKGVLGDWRLRLVGSGEHLKECREIAAREGISERVSFETEVDHTQLPAFYRSLDLFVLPSYFEGFGCVFTEAWACGTPFITCEGQGMDDLIPEEERSLWLCKPMSPEDLARKILSFYQHRPEQHLSGPIDIDVLVPRFVEQVEALRKT